MAGERRVHQLVDWAEGDILLFEDILTEVPDTSLRESVKKFEGIHFWHAPSRRTTSFSFAVIEPNISECEQWVSQMRDPLRKEMRSVGADCLATIRFWSMNVSCYVVNSVIRDPNRTRATLEPVLPFLKNLFVGLRRLPERCLYMGEMFRLEMGVRTNWDQTIFPGNAVQVFQPFSFTSDPAVCEKFRTADGAHTVTHVVGGVGYDIACLSKYPGEKEVLTECVVRLRVKACSKFEHDRSLVRVEIREGLHWFKAELEHPGLELLPGSPAFARLRGPQELRSRLPALTKLDRKDLAACCVLGSELPYAYRDRWYAALDAAAQLLGSAFQAGLAKRLQVLNLHSLRFRPAGVAQLAAGFKGLPSLRVFDLRCTGFHGVGLRALSQLPGLQVLALGDNWIGLDREDARALVDALPRMPGLLQLSLTNNRLGIDGGDGLWRLVGALQSIPCLRELWLVRNCFGDEGARALAAKLQGMSELLKLGLACNGLSTEAKRDVRSAWGERPGGYLLL